jgi:hypothetical protein
VDRTRAWSNIASGLLIAGLAIGIFGLGFVISLLYLN